MKKSADLAETEVNYLERVFNSEFTNLESTLNDLEELVLKGYVSKTAIVQAPMLPIRYTYGLTVYGLILLREYRSQYT